VVLYPPIKAEAHHHDRARVGACRPIATRDRLYKPVTKAADNDPFPLYQLTTTGASQPFRRSPRTTAPDCKGKAYFLYSHRIEPEFEFRSGMRVTACGLASPKFNKVCRILKERLASILCKIQVAKIMVAKISDQPSASALVIGFSATNQRQVEIWVSLRIFQMLWAAGFDDVEPAEPIVMFEAVLNAPLSRSLSRYFDSGRPLGQ
jgi:hypothetical protein